MKIPTSTNQCLTFLVAKKKQNILFDECRNVYPSIDTETTELVPALQNHPL